MRWLGQAAAAIVYVGLLAPIVFVVGASFTAGGYIRFPPQGLSLRWYSAMLADGDMVDGLLISFEAAAAATAISLVVGTTAALFLQHRTARVRDTLSTLFLSPLAIPLVLTGFALLVMFTRLQMVDITGLIIGHAVVTVPYVLRTTLASLALADPFIARAAAVLGARPWQVFRHVILPGLRPGLLAGGLFAFLSSFNNVTVSVFLSAPGRSTLPVVIFNRMDNMAEPSSAAAASAVIALTALGILLLERKFALFRSLAGRC